MRRANFRHVDKVLDQLGITRIGGALLDLGVSSRQLENAQRGFSMMRNGPLDMRMDPQSDLTAASIVNNYTEEELTRLFRDLGEEPAYDPGCGSAAPQNSLPMFGRFGRAQFKSEVTVHDPQTGQAFIGLKLSIPFGQGG